MVKPVDEILSKEHIEILHEDRKIDLTSLGAGVVGLHPNSAAVMGAVGKAGTGTKPDDLSALERELVVLGAMVASDASDALVAIHIFVALRSGALPGKVANSLLIAGGYSGVQRYVHYLTVLKKVFYLLERKMTEGLYKDGDRAAADKAFLDELAEPLLDHEYDDHHPDAPTQPRTKIVV